MTLLSDTSVENAFWHAYELLDTCAKSGITLKPEKFRFLRREAEFVGFHLGWDHYQPTPERLAAIRDFPMLSQLIIIPRTSQEADWQAGIMGRPTDTEITPTAG